MKLPLPILAVARHNTRMSPLNDPNSDPFHPPTVPVEVHCIHCGQEYESYLIHWEEFDTESGRQGFWCCPTPGCDGKGFGFDIFPTDPDYVDEHGNKMWHDDEEDAESEDFFDDETGSNGKHLPGSNDPVGPSDIPFADDDDATDRRQPPDDPEIPY